MKLITDVENEPITLTEVKSHLRLDSNIFSDNLTTYQNIKPDNHAIGTVNVSGVDVLGKRAIVNINSGTNGSGGKVNIKIQESDDNLIYTDWHTFTEITEANDNTVYEKEYTGAKQYIRCIAVVTVASCTFSCDIIIDSGDASEDNLLKAFITTARIFGEDYTSHKFASQTWEFYLDTFPGKDYIEWPNGPLTSITSIKYKNSSGIETTMDVNTQYIVDTNIFPGKVFLPYGKSWPSFIEYPYQAISIRGVCGYNGAVPFVIPETFKLAMLMHIGLMYKYRDSGIPPEDMRTVHNLYSPRRSGWW
jgi:uncharacterized phiE125 gp8 family phage protein